MRASRAAPFALTLNSALCLFLLIVTDNPRHLQIMELEGAQLPRVLDDPKVDVAIISITYIQQTGLSPVYDSVFIEDKNSPYVNYPGGAGR